MPTTNSPTNTVLQSIPEHAATLHFRALGPFPMAKTWPDNGAFRPRLPDRQSGLVIFNRDLLSPDARLIMPVGAESTHSRFPSGKAASLVSRPQLWRTERTSGSFYRESLSRNYRWSLKEILGDWASPSPHGDRAEIQKQLARTYYESCKNKN